MKDRHNIEIMTQKLTETLETHKTLSRHWSTFSMGQQKKWITSSGKPKKKRRRKLFWSLLFGEMNERRISETCITMETVTNVLEISRHNKKRMPDVSKQVRQEWTRGKTIKRIGRGNQIQILVTQHFKTLLQELLFRFIGDLDLSGF